MLRRDLFVSLADVAMKQPRLHCQVCKRAMGTYYWRTPRRVVSCQCGAQMFFERQATGRVVGRLLTTDQEILDAWAVVKDKANRG